MQVRVMARRDVGDDGAELGIAQGIAVDLGPDMAERIQRRCMGHRDQLARLRPQRRPCRFGQASDVLGQPIPIDDAERRHDAAAAGRQLHARLGRETLRPADRAVAPHVDHRLLMGVDAGAPRLQRVHAILSGAGAGAGAGLVQVRRHTRSTVCRYSGTATDQPSSWSIRARSASAASGSPWVTKVRRGVCVKPRIHARISSASAWAERLSSEATSARIGTSWPWMRTVDAPCTIAAPRVPPAW